MRESDFAIGMSGLTQVDCGRARVGDAVATAGGFTYRADKKNVFIKHNGETSEVKGELTPSIQVAPGDTIRIGERFF